MTIDINDGESAFPCKDVNDHEKSVRKFYHKEMTIRDYFAGQALMGIITNYTGLNIPYGIKTDVEDAYKYADAMITERSKNEQ